MNTSKIHIEYVKFLGLRRNRRFYNPAISGYNRAITNFSIATDSDVSNLAKKGWLFDWTDESLGKANIYKLLIKDDDTIQGLVAAEV